MFQLHSRVGFILVQDNKYKMNMGDIIPI